MSESFAELFRPKNPKQLIGEAQKKVAQTLMDNVQKGKIIQEVLFSGDSGIGKTTIARMYISAVLGYEYDGNPYNCGDKTGIDYVRTSINGTINYLPLDSNYRVYFLDEIHKLSEEAQSGLLVTIEPVPAHVLFVACTTHPEKLIPTLRSRMTEFKLMPPSTAEFQELAKWITIGNKKRTGQECKVEDKTRDQIIGLAGGNVRQFVRYFQQALDGSFTETDEAIEKQQNLAKLLIFGTCSLSELFNSVDNSTDYVREAIGLSRYALAILKNPRNNGRSIIAAETVLEVFGNKPSKEIDGDTTFFSKLLEVHKRLRSK